MNATTTPAWSAPTSGAADAAGRVGRDARVNPYVGPRALETGEAIHGRAREIADIRGLLMAHRIVLLYSPSGAGKTSLIEAGLRPEMERRDFIVLPTIRVGHEPATDAGRGRQNRYCSSVIDCLEERSGVDRQLTPDEVAAADLGEYLNQLAESDPDQKWCLFFDQFEELFTMNPADVAAKEAFLRQLGVALKNRNFWALIAMREDFIAHLDPHVDMLPTRLKTRFRLDLLTPESAKEAAREPAIASGVEFEEAAVEKLIDDLRQIRVQHFDETTIEPGPHVEPLQLQVVCRRLWTPTTTSIGVDDLDKLGGVDQALALYYQDAIDKTVKQTSVNEHVLRSWFDTDLITTDGFRKPVREGPGAAGKDRGKEVLQQLEEAYLIRKDRRNGTDWYELTHDRIVKPIRDSNREFRSKRRARRRRVIAIVAAIAAVIGAIVLVIVAGGEARRLNATETGIPSSPEVPTLEPGGFYRFLITPDEGDNIRVTLFRTGGQEAMASTSAKVRLFRVVDGELNAELASDSLRVVAVDVDKDEEPAAQADVPTGSDDTAEFGWAVSDEDLSLVVEVSSQPGGDYELNIDKVEPEAGSESPTLQLDDEPVDGVIVAAGVVDNYAVAGVDDGAVRVVVSPSDADNGFDPVVTMREVDGDEVAFTDRVGAGQAEVLVAKLAAGYDYLVEVSGYEDSTGAYLVSLELVTTTPLSLGTEPVDGRVADVGDVTTYTVADPDGGDVRLVVSPRDESEFGLDSVATMRDAEGGEVAFADNGVSGEPEVLVATLDAGAEYLVDVSGYEDSTGEYSVSVERISTTPLEVDDLPKEGVITGADDIATYAVTIPADVDIGSIEVVPSPDLDVQFEIADPFGNSEMLNDVGTGGAEILDLAELGVGAYPSEQRWWVIVSSVGDTAGGYEIRVTSAG